MKPSKYIFYGALALAALVILRLTVFAPRPNDQQLIEEALTQSIEASREGRPGGVMDKLSASLRINGMRPGSRGDIAKFIRDNKPEVEVQNKTAFVTGDTARIVTPVTVRVSFLTMKWNQTLPEVTLVFQREDARRFIVIPTRQWRLSEVIVPEGSIPTDLPSMGQGGADWGF